MIRVQGVRYLTSPGEVRTVVFLSQSSPITSHEPWVYRNQDGVSALVMQTPWSKRAFSQGPELGFRALTSTTLQ